MRDFLKRAVAWLKPKPLSIPAADGPKKTYGPPAPTFQRPVVDMDELIDKHMPRTTALRMRTLIKVYAETDIEFPHLKGITVAQWCIESAWGSSRAAREDGNFAGMKWREGDRKYNGTPSKVHGNDGYERVNYTHFSTKTDFIRAYWGRLDEVSAYKGWRKNTQSPITFIGTIGPPWVYYHPNEYVQNVILIWKKHTRFLFDE
jgi:hypothetical protein